jgi:hypothetical protein
MPVKGQGDKIETSQGWNSLFQRQDFRVRLYPHLIEAQKAADDIAPKTGWNLASSEVSNECVRTDRIAKTGMAGIQGAGNSLSHFFRRPGVFFEERLDDLLDVGEQRAIAAISRRDFRRVVADFGSIYSGLDEDHIYAERRHLICETLGPALDCPLRGAVGRVERLASEAGTAGHDKNAAVPLLSEDREQRLREFEHTEKIRFHEATQFRLRQILKCRRAERNACIVHDRIKPASGSRKHVPDCSVHRHRIGYVKTTNFNPCADTCARDRLIERGSTFEIAHGGKDLPPAHGKLDGRDEPKAARGSSYQNRRQ